MQERIITIGDVHGCLKSLEMLIETIIKPSQNDTLIFTGDYVCRGPLIPQTIDYIINLKKQYKTSLVLGNHDQMFIKYLKHELHLDGWQTFRYNGGSETISQYEKYLQKSQFSWDDLPQEHQVFFDSLEPIIIDYEHDVIFVHAGLRPSESIIHQTEHDLLWIRDAFLNSNHKWGDFKIVHGHTPMTVNEAKIYNRKHPERFNVDNGCVFGYNLSGVDVLTGDIYTVKCEDNTKYDYTKSGAWTHN